MRRTLIGSRPEKGSSTRRISGIHHDRAGQRGPATHAAREFPGIEVPRIGKAYRDEPAIDLGLDIHIREMGVLTQRQRDVLRNRHRVEQRSPLKEHPDPVSHLE